MIDLEYAKKQVMRLAELNSFPIAVEGITELTIAAQCADSYEACDRAINEFTQYATDCPKPAELRRTIFTENERYAEHRKKTKCSRCGGIGFISGVFLVTKHFDGERAWVTKQELTTDAQIKAVRANLKEGQQIYDGAEPCPVCHPKTEEAA